jgi:hypothetical protein
VGRGYGSIGLLALLAALTIGGWSLLFPSTYDYSFFWDDFHFIRCYSGPELLSTFHGPNDPDGIETPALRPVATLLFHAQGCLLGENVRLQRAFMAGLMGVLLWTIGLLLREVGLSPLHTTIVFLLFASSRVFASLILWITLGSVILAHISMVLTACFHLRWTRLARRTDLALMALCAVVTTFCREGAYTLPLVLPGLWLLARRREGSWRRALEGAALVLAIVGSHFLLREVFIPRPLEPRLTLEGAARVVASAASAWCPGGLEMKGDAARLLGGIWIAFSCVLPLAFVGGHSRRGALRFFGACMIGVALSTPALAIARSFGLALPCVAFFTAVSMAVVEMLGRTRKRPLLGPAAACLVLGGLAAGVVGGIRRSSDVADSMHDNCASKVLRDGRFLFDRRWATVPPPRRKAGLARLAALGIRSPSDLQALERDMHHPRRYFRNQETRVALFLTKYDYLSF